MTGVAVIGATGRMGAALLAALDRSDDLRPVAALTHAGHSRLDEPAINGLTFSADLKAGLRTANVCIDFALADGLAERAAAVVAAGCPWVIGTTALAANDRAKVAAAARHIAVLLAPNLSLGVNACFLASAKLASILGDDYDIDIIDMHHRGKLDAPSGTALEFGRVIAAARDVDLTQVSWDSADAAPRPAGRIGFAAVRAGAHAGEHRILFSSPIDTIELTHRAASRAGFVSGALAAARWLRKRPPGLYSVADMLAGE